MITWIVIGVIAVFSIGCYTKLKLREMDFLCKHEWKTVEKKDLIDENKAIIGAYIIQQCVHCGCVRSKNLDGTDRIE